MVIADICKTLQISRPTLYRWLAVMPPVGGDDRVNVKAGAPS
jgi:hypothetical protein